MEVEQNEVIENDDMVVEKEDVEDIDDNEDVIY